MSIVEDLEKLIWKWREVPSYKKILEEYSDRYLKETLWYEFCESFDTNWSELPAEQKSDKAMLINF